MVKRGREFGKKGIMLQTVVRLVIVSLCIVVLGLVFLAVFNMLSNNKEQMQAKATLGLIVKTMNDASLNKLKIADALINLHPEVHRLVYL